MRTEPLAYILGSKEFFGLPFLVSPATLIPRPETELMVEEALEEVKSHRSSIIRIIDVGTGSGNIIISIAKKIHHTWTPDVHKGHRVSFCAIDISKAALTVARRNAKKNNVTEKIKFLHGNLLEPILKRQKFEICNLKFVILANLPYLSEKIYTATLPTVKKFEPKSALYSPKKGLGHYEKLFRQINLLKKDYPSSRLICYAEISPEQKTPMQSLVRNFFPLAGVNFKKDLAGKWRLAIITL